MLDELDRTGVERALVLSTTYVNATDVAALGARTPSDDEYRLVRQDNDFTAAEAAKAPTRLIPFASVNPKREYALEEVKRCIERLNMRGVKLHFANSDIRLRDQEHRDRVFEVFRYAAGRHIPVVAHIHNELLEAFGAREIEILIAELVEPLPARFSGCRRALWHRQRRGMPPLSPHPARAGLVHGPRLSERFDTAGRHLTPGASNRRVKSQIRIEWVTCWKR